MTWSTPALYGNTDLLSRRERLLIAVCERVNERPLAKRLQRFYHDMCGRRWVWFCIKNRVQVYDLHHPLELRPPAGVIICSNHRTFFDMYVIATVLTKTRVPWMRDLYFPVRSNYFYESWTGLLVNLLIGGGAMYPPIFRSKEKAILNQMALERLVTLLQKRGVVVGMHPEGTRGKGPDPYELLRARSGVGQMALRANVPVLPIWINGLSNNLRQQVVSNFKKGAGRDAPIRVVFGAPVDLSGLSGSGTDKVRCRQAAECILADIRALGARERAMSGDFASHAVQVELPGRP